MSTSSKYSHMTAAECTRMVGSLKDSVQYYGVLLSPSSELGTFIGDLEWMGSFEADPLRDGGAKDDDSTRAGLAVLRAEQLRRIERPLRACKNANISLPSALLTKLQKRIDCLTARNLPAQDHLLELEVGGKLVIAGHDVEFIEPDLVVGLAGKIPKIGVPCKRPRNASSIASAIRKARRQLRCAQVPGIIFVGAEALLYHFSDPEKPHLFLPNEPTDIKRDLLHKLNEFFYRQDVLEQVKKAFDEGCLAVVSGATIAALCKRTGPLFVPGADNVYAREWLEWAVINSEIAGASTACDAFRRALHH